MTTPRMQKIQAERIAAALKKAERGEPIGFDPGGKIRAARDRPSIIFGVVTDDRILSIEMTWTQIHDMSEEAISEYVVKQMRKPL
jgi:hypothetical protein